MVENRVPRKIFGSKKGSYRRTAETARLVRFTFQAMKSRTMCSEGNWKIRNSQKVWSGNLKRRDHSGDYAQMGR
jgi:hypothetical protein